MKQKLAAFIITFDRPSIILGTIEKIFEQSLAPDKILVVDNSATTKTKEIIESLCNDKIEYFPVGYNSGASGGAHFGIKILAAQGYDKVVWCDDDDPPLTNDTFEILAGVLDEYPDAGIAAATGNLFDRRFAKLRRFETSELLQAKILEVDASAGGSFMMANKPALRSGILPERDLFFGFEDLDYCLAIRRAKLQILVPSALFYRYRESVGNLDYKNKQINLKPNYGIDKIWRYYYSNRNLIYIMLYKEKLYLGTFIVAIKALTKPFAAVFTVNFTYGFRYFTLMVKAIFHGITKKLGRVSL